MILVFNVGSSSVKFSLYNRTSDSVNCLFQANIDLNHKQASLTDFNQSSECGLIDCSPLSIVKFSIDQIGRYFPNANIEMVGHRVVYGGDCVGTMAITRDLLIHLDSFSLLAPLHQPQSLTFIKAVQSLYPAMKQYACFDTSFHQTMPKEETVIALPKSLQSKEVQRYGFHGLSYQYIATELARLNPNAINERIVIAHIGSGVSLCGLTQLQSRAATMGFSPLEGIPMASRSGNIDPALVLYLSDKYQISNKDLELKLNEEAGLKGLSGHQGDIQSLLMDSSEQSDFAITFFVYQIVKQLGSIVAAIGGIDCLVFTAGVGEHSAEIRKQICQRLNWLGIEIDEKANLQNKQIISSSSSQVSVKVIPTDETAMIAKNIYFKDEA
ncbi:MAG: acetate kinase [Gammaproteobacteria bacterium]|nr:MAG: acetate kinase [Gammaproteobacteria bacterium]